MSDSHFLLKDGMIGSHINITVANKDSGALCCELGDTTPWCIQLQSQPPDQPIIITGIFTHNNSYSSNLSVECMMGSNMAIYRDNSVFTLLEGNYTNEYYSNNIPNDSINLAHGVTLFTRRQQFSRVTGEGRSETPIACWLKIAGHHQLDRITFETFDPNPTGPTPTPTNSLSPSTAPSSTITTIAIGLGCAFAAVIIIAIAIKLKKKCASTRKAPFLDNGVDQNGDNGKSPRRSNLSTPWCEDL